MDGVYGNRKQDLPKIVRGSLSEEVTLKLRPEG